MARHLTEVDVEQILSLIDGWQHDLKWDLLIKACEIDLGIKTTRQALSRKTRIKDAFNQRKRALKYNGGSYYARPNSLNLAHERLDRLAQENERLKLENARLLERVIRWQYNAKIRGITQEMLDRPLPPQDHASDRS